MTCKKILLTAARSPAALEVARHLHHGGHEVYVADPIFLHVSRFSNAVKKSFITPIPSKEPNLFIQCLIDIIKRENIDLLIPIWEEVFYISKAIDQFPNTCKVFCSPFELMHKLHNKFSFIQELERLDIITPKTVLLRNLEEQENIRLNGPYAIKACYSRASRSFFKVTNGELPEIIVQSTNPWIAQEWIDGERFCTYSICNHGKVSAHATYPVYYTLQDKNSCIAFEAFDHPEILAWIEKLAAGLNYTGQFAFDFIQRKDGTLFAIECNPRATSGVHLFTLKDDLSKAFLNETLGPIIPKQGASKQIATGMLMYGLKFAFTENRLAEYIKKIITTQDVVFSWKDLKPFIFQPFVFFNYWLISLKRGSTIPEIFTDDFDWNGS